MKTIRMQRRQQGAILIIALVMLVLITLVTVSTVRSNIMDERMAGNARDRDKALQAAEGAVRTCLGQIVAVPSTYPAAKILTPTSPPTKANWDVDSTWADSSTEVDMTTSAGLAANPKCLVEDLGGGIGYRVTARAVGGSSLSVVMLQATYSAE